MYDLTAQSQQVFSSEHPYESEVIRKINDCLDKKDMGPSHSITLHMLDYPDQYHHIDFMALGRALQLLLHNSACYQIGYAIQLPKRYPELTQKMLTSYQVGRIAAEISARNANDTTTWTDWHEKEFQKKLNRDHSTSVTCAEYHPDPTVREMAAWCAAHLIQIRAQKMGFTPQPSPTQTPPPYPQG